MAIIEDLGLEANIFVNNSPLQEYEDNQEDPTDDGFGDEIRKCRRYVEVVENAEFTVQLLAAPNNDHFHANENNAFAFALDLDGEEDFEGRVVDSTVPSGFVEGKDEYDGQQRTLRKFRFTTVSTIDDDETERVEKDKETARHLGLLRVRVWRIEITDRSEPRQTYHSTAFDEVNDQLAEKALKGKALSHRVTLSAAVPVEALPSFYYDHVDPLEMPLAIFYFKYRSRAVLQEELVIPRSREPSPVGIDVDGLSLREIHRLARESLDHLPLHQVRRLAQLRLSSRKKESNISSERAVKREHGEEQISQRPRKFVRMSDGREALDLTDDD